jgi:hypothetical protein
MIFSKVGHTFNDCIKFRAVAAPFLQVNII